MNEAIIPLEKGAESQTPSRIVVHAMGEFIDIEPEDYSAVEFLRKLGLSAHAFITPSGVVIRSRRDDQHREKDVRWIDVSQCTPQDVVNQILAPGFAPDNEHGGAL